MQFLAIAALALTAAVAPAAAAPLASPFMGVINAPTASSIITPGTAFPFDYAVSNWCEEGYNNFKVFLTAGTAPTFANVNATGDIPNAIASLGEYAAANFGLPEPSNPAPSSLTVPSTSALLSDGESTFLTVVQMFTSCPGDVPEEIGVTSVPFVWVTSS